MIEYSLPIAAIVFLAIAVVVFHIVHGVLKAAMLVAAISAVALGISAFLVISDASTLKQNFSNGPNLLILKDGNSVLSAVTIANGTPSLVNQQGQDIITEQLLKHDYAAIKENNYKLIIVDVKALDGFGNGTLAIASKEYSKEDVKALLQAGSPELKALAFGTIFEKLISDPVLLIKEYKKGDVEVHEETAVFKAMRVIPLPIIQSAAKEFVQNAKNTVVDTIGA